MDMGPWSWGMIISLLSGLSMSDGVDGEINSQFCDICEVGTTNQTKFP